jgi:hypothetical protein
MCFTRLLGLVTCIVIHVGFIRMDTVIYTPRGQGTNLLKLSTGQKLDVLSCDGHTLTQLNKSSWIRGGGARPTHFPPRGPM